MRRADSSGPSVYVNWEYKFGDSDFDWYPADAQYIEDNGWAGWNINHNIMVHKKDNGFADVYPTYACNYLCEYSKRTLNTLIINSVVILRVCIQ